MNLIKKLFIFLIVMVGVCLTSAKTTYARDKKFTEVPYIHLSQEVLQLRADMESLHKKLTDVLKNIQQTPKAIGEKNNVFFVNHWALHSIEKASDFILKRGRKFTMGITGLYAIIPTLFHNEEVAIWHFVACVVSLALSFVLVGCIRFIFHARVAEWYRISSQKQNNYTLRLLTVLLILPTMGFFIIAAVLNLLLKLFFLLPHKGQLSYVSLLPLHTYITCAGFYWVRTVFILNRPLQGIISWEPEKVNACCFYMRMIFVSHMSTIVLLALFEYMLLSGEIIRTVWDTALIVMAFLLWKALSCIRAGAVINNKGAAVMKQLFWIKWSLFMGGGLWLLLTDMLFFCIIPTIVTICGFLLMGPLEFWLRKTRLQFLWAHRQKPFLLRPLFTSIFVTSLLPRYTIYGALCIMWAHYLYTDDPNILFTLFESTHSVVSALFTGRVLNMALIFLVSIFLVKGGDRILKYYVEDKYTKDSRENNFIASRLKTLTAMLRTTVRVVVWVPAVSLALSQFEVFNVTGWMTSIGAASFGLTFGLQSIVRDFITGFFIIVENNLMVGDEVEIDQRKGKVEVITIRTLKIRAENGTLLTIPFGSITVIGNKNRHFGMLIMNISVEYTEDLDRIYTAIERAFNMVKRNPLFTQKIIGPLDIRGIQEITAFSVVLQVKIKTLPTKQDEIRRVFNRQLKNLFDEAGIRVPVPPYTIMHADPSLTNTII